MYMYMYILNLSAFFINVKYIKIIQGDISFKISDISNLTNLSHTEPE